MTIPINNKKQLQKYTKIYNNNNIIADHNIKTVIMNNNNNDNNTRIIITLILIMIIIITMTININNKNEIIFVH